jgi:hypothetical protein
MANPASSSSRSKPAKVINFVPDVIQPKPKQQQLFDVAWRGVQTGDPEFMLWGGAAGPGKSWGLRWLGIILLIKIWKTYGLENVQGVLFCIDYPRLKDRHVNAMKAVPSWLGRYNEQSHDFTLTQDWGGGILSFRNLKDPGQYDSAQFAFELVDELTELDRDQLDEILIRKRWPGVPHSPLIASCNPRRKGLRWVRKLWIEHDFSGDRDRGLADANFWFLQALPADNDSLPASYYDALNRLGPTLKRALVQGDWYVSEDQAFLDFTKWKRTEEGLLLRTAPMRAGGGGGGSDAEDEGELIPWHVIPTADVPSQWRRIASHDWGYRAPGHHLWGAIDPRGGIVIYREWSFKGLDPQDIAAGILYRQAHDKVMVTYADPSIWQERKKADLSQDQIDTLEENDKLRLSKYSQYMAAGLFVERANNARVAGAALIHTLLKDRGDGVPYLRIMDCCPVLIATLQDITLDPNNLEDVLTEYLADDDLRDDPYDALRYLCMGVPPPRGLEGIDGVPTGRSRPGGWRA